MPTIALTFSDLLSKTIARPPNYCQRKKYAPSICPYCNSKIITVSLFDHPSPTFNGYKSWYWYCRGGKCGKDMMKQMMYTPSPMWDAVKKHKSNDPYHIVVDISERFKQTPEG